jgi:hypothetical protein
MMISFRLFFSTLAIACLLLVCGAAASTGLHASMGEVIPLSGYSYGSNTVYLFLTGPNLPSNGVALNDISRRADQGGFTTVDVDSNSHWEYDWSTANAQLDSGTYTVWVSNGPNDRSRLSEADYSTISVTLGKPGITAGVGTGSDLTTSLSVQPGNLSINSNPAGSSVTVNNAYVGKTPLEIGGLAPGTYEIAITRFGYEKFNTTAPVKTGSITEISADLIQEQGSLNVTTDPSGAEILLDGQSRGISPITLDGIPSGSHTIGTNLSGFAPKNQTVVIEYGRTTPLSMSLDPVTPQPTLPAAGGLPATIFAGIVLVVLAAVSRTGNR